MSWPQKSTNMPTHQRLNTASAQQPPPPTSQIQQQPQQQQFHSTYPHQPPPSLHQQSQGQWPLTYNSVQSPPPLQASVQQSNNWFTQQQSPQQQQQQLNNNNWQSPPAVATPQLYQKPHTPKSTGSLKHPKSYNSPANASNLVMSSNPNFFENNAAPQHAAADGWGDWGDWNDNNQQKQQPPIMSASNNHNYVMQHQQSPMQQQQQQQQHQATPPMQQPHNPSQYASPAPAMYGQPNAAPLTYSGGGISTNANYYQSPPQQAPAPLQNHHSAAVTSSGGSGGGGVGVYQNYNQNVIAESFVSENENWNWGVDDLQSKKQQMHPQQMQQEMLQQHQLPPPPSSSQQQSQQHPENTQYTKPVFEKVSISAIKSTNEMVESAEQTLPPPPPQSTASNDMLQSDELKNSLPSVHNALLTRVLKSDHQLTPQWSVESQMSHTSSDRSIESDALDSRSSNTNTSEDNNFGRRPSYPIESGYGNIPQIGETTKVYTQVEQNIDNNTDMDSLDQALQSMSVAKSEQQSFNSFYQQSSMPPTFDNIQMSSSKTQPLPPLSISQDAVSLPPQSTFSPAFGTQDKPVALPLKQFALRPSQQSSPMEQHQSAMLMQDSEPSLLVQQQPPDAPIQSTVSIQQSQQNTMSGNIMPATPPQIGSHSGLMSSSVTTSLPSSLPPPTVQSGAAANNPYKRGGLSSHRNVNQFQAPAAKPPTMMPSTFYQPTQLPELNQETLLPENSEIVGPGSNATALHEVENHEIAPINERNQYLQTGHLSDEGSLARGDDTVPDGSESLPPPGLSRLVLGQPETADSSSNQPPPGLDRMVPGTELANSTNLNLQRQADGQDTMPTRVVNFPPPPPQASEVHGHSLDITDRNLYLVPGESEHHQPQRVVTGIENIGHTHATSVPEPHHVNDQQRELDMDGENLEDEQQQQQQLHIVPAASAREEPIEGANTLDEPPAQSIDLNMAEVESNITMDIGRKDLSNPSTCNDDSDKDRYYKGSRRVDDNSRRRRDKPSKRYETEDTDYYSDRDRRAHHREGRDPRNADPRDREQDRDGRDHRDRSDRNRERRAGSEKERERPRENRDRDRERNSYERDRYDRERYNRYETDGSRYETEGSRYDKEKRKAGGKEESSRREDKDRKYRRDRDGERERDREVGRGDRRKDERYYEDRDRRRHHDRDRRYEYEEDYRRSGSRNASDRERERGGKHPSTQTLNQDGGRYGAQGYYPNNYAYDPYYYQQQQYYEQLRRTNPTAYAEWYKRYYSQMQQQQLAAVDPLAADGRESVHSGRSSANEKEQRPDGHDTTGMGNTTNQESARLTPCKFTVEHCTASLANGLLVCVKPKYSPNGVTNVVKVLNMGFNDGTRKLFQYFPGPLIRGVTHKKTVIEFCEDQIRQGPPSMSIKSRSNSVSSIFSMGQANKASFTLMWKLLILLLRQNGMVVGTDISELLMRNVNDFAYEPASSQKVSTTSGRNSAQSEQLKQQRDERSPSDEEIVDELNEDRSPSEEREEVEKTLTETEITEKFRSHLLYGNVSEALEWATDNNLWGHALFLASKVDKRSHANVMMKFANKLSLNDPLQTLYQLMSGRTPSSVTSIQDEKWGDWRPHLAMILSNTSQRPELDRKAITTLGDSLYNRNDLFGAQFCYLMAQVGFGKYCNVNQESTLMSNSASAIRLILLGSSHHKSFREFATNEAIMMTEIYEYACSLNDDKFSIVEFQTYKYLLGTRFLDYGMHLKALMYMEQVARHIQNDPSKFESQFIEKVFSLADQLKYNDPVMEKSLDDESEGNQVDQENLQWIDNLQIIIKQFGLGNISYQSASVQNLTALSTPDLNTQYSSQTTEVAKQQIDQQFTEINRQFQELNMQYTNADPTDQPQSLPAPASEPYNGAYEQQAAPASLDYNQQQMYQPVPTISEQPPQPYDSYNPNSYDQQLAAAVPDQTLTQPSDYGNYYGNSQQHQPQVEQTTPTDPYGQQQQQPGSYDYWNQQPQQPQQQQLQQPDEIPKPTISMPNSMSSKPGFFDDSDSHQQQSNPQGKPSAPSKEASLTKKPAPSGSNNANSGWFGGIWNKLSLKPKNQMILPDDKNPSIVWDPDKKRWVNTDGGDAAEEEQFRPPPKMSDLGMPPPSQQQPQPPQMQAPTQHFNSVPPPNVPEPMRNAPSPSNYPMVGAPNVDATNPMRATVAPVVDNNAVNAKTPSLQSNMFKMQRNRTLKKSYVDVFNPSGAPAKPIEAPMMAPMVPAAPQSGFFVPGAPVNNDDASIDPQQQTQEGAPQFYNPNQYTAGGYQ